MLIRLTTILVVSCLWQFSILETYTFVNTSKCLKILHYKLCLCVAIPSQFCSSDYHCFATSLGIDSFFTAHSVMPVSCSGTGSSISTGDGTTAPTGGGSSKYVLNCVRWMPQNSSDWIKSLAIVYSLAMLVTKVP